MDLQSENRILSSIPDDERECLLPRLEEMPLYEFNQILSSTDRHPYAYFVIRGGISLLAECPDGESLEVGVIGSEGVVGAEIVFSNIAEGRRAIVLQSGRASRINITDLESLLYKCPRLRCELVRYLAKQYEYASQLALCQSNHTLKQRMSRWLLTISDRVGSSDLKLTQERMAELLSVRRTSLTSVARTLQEQGALEYRRGRLHIRDRAELTRMACVCYEVIRNLI